MTDGVSASVDLLAVLHANVKRILEALEAAPTSSDYIDGQTAYLQALDEALAEASDDVVPRDVLADVAADLGLELEGGRLNRAPRDQREAGAFGMWALCLGYVEGAADGIRAAMSELGEAKGLPP